MMKNLSLVAAALLASLSLSAYAAHNGAGGGGHMGGMSSQHMSSHGMTNTNGPDATDRAKGIDRAAERRNAEATSHEQADTQQATHKKGKSH